jgi:nucleotide-binding universal stress UspA family protein
MNGWSRSGPVVVEVDGSVDGLRVVEYAGQTALGARTELVLVAPYHGYAAYSPMRPLDLPQSPAAVADKALQDAVRQLRHKYGPELTVRTVSAEGSRLKVLRDAARDARVLVVGRRHDGAAAGLVSAQGNLGLAGRVGCPVIVVPPRLRPNPAERDVAVGIDGTALSLEAVEFAFRTAADRGGELTVVHSHQLPYRRLAADDGSWQERAALTISETLAGWDEEYPNVKVTRMITTRPVVATLARQSEQVGLVVVGAHAGPLPIGDPNARHIITELTCPVAVVAHHVTAAERRRRDREIPAGPDIVVPTY